MTINKVQEQASHWQLDALEALREPAAPEMWFPSRMLVPLDGDSRRARGVSLVSLCGAKGVGKTYVAMHALDHQGVPGVLADYIYCYPPSAELAAVSGAEFLTTIRLREVMARNDEFQAHLQATPARPRNLKASFFVPADSPSHGVTGSLKSWLKRCRDRAFFRTPSRLMVLYDLAGEKGEEHFSPIVAEHDQAVDVVAVFITAPALMGMAPEVVMSTAANRLREVAARKQNAQLRCALVVTKCDMVQDGADLTAARMTELCARSQSASTREVGSRLESRVVDEVFFLRPDDPAKPAPTLLGLDAFARWCTHSR